MDQPSLPLAHDEGPGQDRMALLLSIHPRTTREILVHAEDQIAAEASSAQLLSIARDILRDAYDPGDPEDEVQAFSAHTWQLALDGVTHADTELLRQFHIFVRVRAEARRRQRRAELAFGHRARRMLQAEQRELAMSQAATTHSSAESGAEGDHR